MRLSRTAAIAPAALLGLLASHASAAYSANVSLALEYVNSNGFFSYQVSPTVYNASGFTDPSDPGNFVQVSSPSGLASGTPGFSTPAVFTSLSDLIDELVAGSWTLEITDGVTAEMRSFAFDIAVDAGLTNDYFRAITPVGFGPGSTIPQTPTFEWAVEPAAFPEAEFDQTVPSIQGPAFEFGTVPANTTMWTPTVAPLAPGPGYLFAVFERNFSNALPGLLTFSDILATDGGEELDNPFAGHYLGSKMIITDLEVVPAPGPLALAGFAGVMGLRRRR